VKRKDLDVLPGMEPEPPPFVAVPSRPMQNPNRIEDVANRIRQREAVYGSEFRLDAVAHTLVLMVARQTELARRALPGEMCHQGMDDEELEATFHSVLEFLRFLHGRELFPDGIPVWRPDNLRAWVALWEGIDLIGREGELADDVVALTFQHAATMDGKQKDLGAFITPYNVCKLMVAMSAHDQPRPWTVSMNEPCMGPGSFLTAWWDRTRLAIHRLQLDGHVTNDEAWAMVRQFVRNVHAQDIDGQAVWTCAAQLTVRTGVTVTAPHPYH
jgi:hypothetical protein